MYLIWKYCIYVVLLVYVIISFKIQHCQSIKKSQFQMCRKISMEKNSWKCQSRSSRITKNLGSWHSTVGTKSTRCLCRTWPNLVRGCLYNNESSQRYVKDLNTYKVSLVDFLCSIFYWILILKHFHRDFWLAVSFKRRFMRPKLVLAITAESVIWILEELWWTILPWM